MKEQKISIRKGEVIINYSQSGEGEFTLLFLHGWCINHMYWSSQRDFFKDQYKIICMDLPGFGKSTANRENWTIEDYSQDILEAIEQLKLENIIVIGHSMSGDIMLEMALQENPRIKGIIGIDNYKMVDVQISEEQMKQYESLFKQLETDFPKTAMSFADQMLFHPTTKKEDSERVKNDILNSDHKIAYSALSNYVLYEAQVPQKLESLNLKLNLLSSDAIPTNVDGLKNRCKSGFELTEIPATGHYPMIEKPDEFNKLLDNILNNILSSQNISNKQTATN